MRNFIASRQHFNVIQYILIIYFAFFTLNVCSQDNNATNTEKKEITNVKSLFDTAKKVIDNGNYKEAVLLISKYYNSYADNLELNWLYAHALWLNNKEKIAKSIFKKALSFAPNNRELRLDYARFLYQTGQIIELEPILKAYLKSDNSNIEYLEMLGYIQLWRGKIKEAKNTVAALKKTESGALKAKSLKSEIDAITAAYISSDFEYQTDSQPLDFFASHFKVSQYKSRFFNPELRISSYRFSPEEERAFTARFSNQFSLDKLKLKGEISLGVYNNISDGNDWIGGLNFVKEFFKNTNLKFGYDKSQLLTTIASTRFNLTQQDLFGEFYHKNKYITVSSGYHHNFFDDGNYIYSIFAWALLKPITIKSLEFQLGYSYNFTDSKEVLFIFSDINTGIYDPYFTPKDLETHSILFSANYNASKKLTIQAKINYGLVGNVQNPYPIQATPTSVEIGGFYADTFTPQEITGTINYKFSNKFSTRVTYINQKTFFYERENINVGLNIKI